MSLSSAARARANAETAQDAQGALYRAFWRWHFYAGLVVMPILMLMALTGGLYLFKDEINAAIYRPLLTAPASPVTTPPQAWADAALAAAPGDVVQVAAPARETESARIVVQAADGTRRAVYVDPHTARVLGATPEGGVMAIVKRLHSLDLAGPWFSILVEMVAGWAIVMVATGIVLWWPRGRRGGALSIRGRPVQRVFWRDLHAVIGIFAGAIIVFLAVTGMPWSAVWGQQVRKLTTEAGWGRPVAPAAPSSHAAFEPNRAVPWALQETELHPGHHMAAAGAHDGHAPAPPEARLDLNRAIAQFDAAKLPRPYVVSIPREAGRSWSASHMPDKVEHTRTVYLDSADGRVLGDIGYGDFGPAAQAIEWGIAVHQGQQFGLINKLIMLAGCIAIWALGVSALAMWWKRRPRGSLGAPPAPANRSVPVGLAAVVAPLAILYPLVGASLISVFFVDVVIRRLSRFRRQPA